MATGGWLDPPPQGVMMARGRFKISAKPLLVGFALIVLIATGSAPAQALPSRGLSISPIFLEVEIGSNDRTSTYGIDIGNGSDVAQKFRLSVVDFGSLDEEGGVAFLGQPASELEHKYGLASWMKLDRTEIVVPAAGSIRVNGTIDNRASLSPGGHYGAILATAITDEGGGSAQSRVGIKQVLSSLVLATKTGGAQKSLQLASQATNGAWWRIPTKISYRFTSTGNVHAVPRGVTSVSDPSGTIVRRSALNEESGAVLPGSSRKYAGEFDDVGTAWMPGRYAITTVYRPDGQEATRSLTTHMWFAGALILWIAGLAAGLAIWGLAWWLRRRMRKRRNATRSTIKKTAK